MATTYTPQTFSNDVIPAGLTNEVKKVIQFSVVQGWNVQVKGLIVRLLSPVGNKTITLSASNKNIPIQQHIKTITKYANPLLALDEEMSDEIIAEAARRGAAQQITAPVKRAQINEPVVEPVIEQVVKTVVEAEDAPLRLVSEGPMISKGGSLGGYTSNIATKREWSDGSVDYQCTRCDFEGMAPRSMASHWGKHVREDERNRGGHKGVEVEVEGHEYTPTPERWDSLAEALKTAMEMGLDWSDLDGAAKHLALSALKWDNDRRKRNEPGIREPLTDTELLDKIRGLVDNGLYASQRDRIDALEEQVAAMESAVAEAQSARQRAEETLDTLADLVSSLKGGAA